MTYGSETLSHKEIWGAWRKEDGKQRRGSGSMRDFGCDLRQAACASSLSHICKIGMQIPPS